MSEVAPTQAASEEVVTPAGPGSTTSGDGGAGGTQTATPSGENFETLARQHQSRADQAEARVKALEAQLQTPATTPAPAAATAAASTTEPPAAATAEDFLALIDRRDAMNEATASLKSEFTLADPALFKNPLKQFDSPEAMKVAVEESHNAIKALVDAQVVTRETEIRAQYAAKYGEIAPPPANAETGAATGQPTLEELAGWSVAQMDSYDREKGAGAFDRLVDELSSRSA